MLKEIARKRHDHLSPSALTRVILFANSSLIITPLIITIRVSNKNKRDEFYIILNSCSQGFSKNNEVFQADTEL